MKANVITTILARHKFGSIFLTIVCLINKLKSMKIKKIFLY